MILKYIIPKLHLCFTLKYVITQIWALTVWKSFHKGLANDMLKKIFGSRREKQITVENYTTRNYVVCMLHFKLIRVITSMRLVWVVHAQCAKDTRSI